MKIKDILSGLWYSFGFGWYFLRRKWKKQRSIEF